MPDIREESDEGRSGLPAVPDYELLDTVVADTAAQLKALADPLRTSILHLLAERAATTTELAEAVGRPHGSVDHHLKVLEAAGLVRVVRSRKVRALTQRWWGRTARTIQIRPIDDAAGRKGVTGRSAGRDHMFLREAITAMVDGDQAQSSLRFARLPADRIEEYGRRLDALAVEFVSEPRAGDTVFALVFAIGPTNQPVLPERST